MKLQVVCMILGIALTNAGVTSPSSEEVKKFRATLDASNVGEYQVPLTADLAERQNAEERSGKFEGDILLTEEQKLELVRQYQGGRNAVTAAANLWPNKVLYYNISPFVFNSGQIAAIKAALQYIESISCLQFKPPVNSNVVVITGNTDGCYSSIGFVGGRQELNLAPATPGSGCMRHGTIVHEFLHALGFYHMQSTFDRDNYVKIVWDKIISGAESNFFRYSSAQVSNLGVPYDYGSVLHYSLYGFSVDGSRTIVPLKPTTAQIGQRISMSPADILKLNKLYKCPGF